MGYHIALQRLYALKGVSDTSGRLRNYSTIVLVRDSIHQSQWSHETCRDDA